MEGDMADWRDLLPANVAKRQRVWEEDQRILRAWASGATEATIARSLQVSKQWVSYRKLRAQRQPIAPVEHHLLEADERFRLDVIKRARKARIRHQRQQPRPRPRKPPPRPFGKRQVITEGDRLVLGDLVSNPSGL
jgi:hypothetical protein